MHHREADQHHDQHQPADETGRRKVVGQIAERRRARSHHPYRQQVPGRNQHHRAVGAARGEAEDEQEPESGDSSDRDSRHSRRDRRVVDREADDGRHQREPCDREMRVAHMPSAQIEIREQEDDERRADGGLNAGAPEFAPWRPRDRTSCARNQSRCTHRRTPPKRAPRRREKSSLPEPRRRW